MKRSAKSQAGDRSATGPATDSSRCDCGLARAYSDCCGAYHAGFEGQPAPTAQALMRSRYSAYVRGLNGYLLSTWHPDNRPSHIEASPQGLMWLGLEVRHETMLDYIHAEVEFVARNKLNGRAQRLHEVSRFVYESGRWFYLDGQMR